MWSSTLFVIPGIPRRFAAVLAFTTPPFSSSLSSQCANTGMPASFAFAIAASLSISFVTSIFFEEVENQSSSRVDLKKFISDFKMIIKSNRIKAIFIYVIILLYLRYAKNSESRL